MPVWGSKNNVTINFVCLLINFILLLVNTNFFSGICFGWCAGVFWGSIIEYSRQEAEKCG